MNTRLKGAHSTKPRREFGSLAQLVEQLAFNQLVGRSSRPRPTILNRFGASMLIATGATGLTKVRVKVSKLGSC